MVYIWGEENSDSDFIEIDKMQKKIDNILKTTLRKSYVEVAVKRKQFPFIWPFHCLEC